MTASQTGWIPAIIAGIIATTISYAGPLVIIFQAAQGLDPALVASWIWAISIGSGLLGIVLSWRWRVPIVIAWSAPGSALLVTMLPQTDFATAIGAYIIANLAVLLVGLSGAFDRLMQRLPAAITAAMLAGILFRFVIDMIDAVPSAPMMLIAMIAAFFAGRVIAPRYAVVAVLVTGVAITALSGGLSGSIGTPDLTMPVWTTPRFDWAATASIAVPLAVVALTGQFLPGIAVLRAAGYDQPAARPIVSTSAIASIALAPFGCHGLNLAAFTAAICLGPDAHPDPARRYMAGIAGGVTYLVFGAFAATVLALFATLPKTLIAALAGLALFPVVANSLSTALRAEQGRDAALVTFAVSASGMTLAGLGSAFWGLIFGLAVHLLQSLVAKRPDQATA
ncbi:benzoate/H(+) symporter BenE family transporter [Sphingobium yanoikuyae]|jgi:benzoate membrane transport protein|uniref:Benzoate transporter BenE n=1 Tax=Sphingobium yanoikuyae TaxID=13690 RepID=A0A085K0R1_SPHYA|nr:benzoate/H(+) symporter BenE family transporter [Sphingobium yanoikuyae]AYO76840.1 benzoate transporter BenE [Sphingobium yanoikuyae]KFD26307.1 benzoate transporter [Sphingobium yanoikuyae]KZC79229.1 benzoate transporter [Sphingobium yanoikuyae]MDV3479491.1 benzoate/H(+) symporter BenE family transporter [Sphingobium yanoikuyae]